MIIKGILANIFFVFLITFSFNIGQDKIKKKELIQLYKA